MDFLWDERTRHYHNLRTRSRMSDAKEEKKVVEPALLTQLGSGTLLLSSARPTPDSLGDIAKRVKCLDADIGLPGGERDRPIHQELALGAQDSCRPRRSWFSLLYVVVFFASLLFIASRMNPRHSGIGNNSDLGLFHETCGISDAPRGVVHLSNATTQAFGVEEINFASPAIFAIPKNDTKTRGQPTLPYPLQAIPSSSKNASSLLQRSPLVDRSILAKLEKLNQSGSDQEDDDTLLQSDLDAQDPNPIRPNYFPPTITSIPEGKLANRRPSSSQLNLADICDNQTPGRSCRFLLPLRIAEQESKARLHFLQLVQLARKLDRILVLPNVGKSRMGACYKWPFSTYYDPGGFLVLGYHDDSNTLDALTDHQSQLRTIRLEDFRTWTEIKTERRGKLLSSQLVSLSTSLPNALLDDAEEIALNETETHTTLAKDLHFYQYDTDLASQTEFPGCFPSKFEPLALADYSLFFVFDTLRESRAISGLPSPYEGLGDKVVDALRFRSPQTHLHPPEQREDTEKTDQIPLASLPDLPTLQATNPEVLIMNWDLRYPLFSSAPTSTPSYAPYPLPAPNTPALPYSPTLHRLSEALAPQTRYLAIHWRMETVDPSVLLECAHALVDVLSTILHDDQHLAKGVESVWFASDYPFPISQSPAARTTQVLAKSGTFRNFNERHDQAIEILREAFKEDGELGGWKLRDVDDAILQNTFKEEEDLLKDTGVLGIIDKMIAIRATLFVSGSKKCSRQSSFTKQVLEKRFEEWSQLANVVTYF